MAEPCKICNTRKPRRYCPGLRADICSICCGTERENTIDCPLECQYLAEAHQRERKPPQNADDFPNQDIRVTDRFLQEREPLLLLVASSITQSALATSGAIDYDIREALQALIRTYRTLQTGLYYEARPDNPVAARIATRTQELIAKFREDLAKEQGLHSIRDSDILGLLVFLERLELQHNNGRKKGRAFLGFLLEFFPPLQPGNTEASGPSILLA
jgi:hypothetical protein